MQGLAKPALAFPANLFFVDLLLVLFAFFKLFQIFH